MKIRKTNDFNSSYIEERNDILDLKSLSHSNMKKRIVIYTAIFSDYDILMDPKYKSKNCDYICFTDARTMKVKIWKIIRLSNRGLSSAMLNRKVKILPHLYFPHYEYSIYVDGNIQIIGDVEQLIDKYLGNAPMACPNHPKRTCIYDEAEVCIQLNIGDTQQIRQQMARYKEISYPENFGLTDNSILLRRHNEPKVIKVMEEWWSELKRGSKRDQLSFGFASWKHNFHYALMEESARKPSPYFYMYPHKPPRIKDSLYKIWIYISINKDRSAIHALLFHIMRWLGKRWLKKVC